MSLMSMFRQKSSLPHCLFETHRQAAQTLPWNWNHSMSALTRRDLFKSGVAAVALPGLGFAAQAAHAGSAGRDRWLLDFGWTFHLGHANDSAKDFGYGADGELFAKSGGFVNPSRPDFDVSGWRKIDLPHDWAVELPFVHDKVLGTHGSKPLGRG